MVWSRWPSVARIQLKCIGNCTKIRGNGTHPLVNLLPPNIMQTTIEILHTLHNIRHLILVLGLNLACLANGHIQGDLDSTLGIRQPPASLDIGLSQETNLVLASISSSKGEAAGVVLALGDDTVVIIEGLVDGDHDAEVVVDGVDIGLGVDDIGSEVT